MTIVIKSPREIEFMREAGRVVANALQEVRERLEPGLTTRELDRVADRAIRRAGGEPAFPHINDFPGTACISVNNEVVHGIPGSRRVRMGDIVKVDVGAIVGGYHGDAAITVPVGPVSEAAARLIEVTERALAVGIETVRPGSHLYDVGAAIQEFVAPYGFSIVRQYVGHGIGRDLHEDPNVPHFRQSSRGPVLRPGMVFTIEPMINAGGYETRLLPDEWTVVTADGRLSAQFEHTVAVTVDGVEILTLPDGNLGWSIPFLTANKVQ